MTYKDRIEAGKLLAFHIKHNLLRSDHKDVVVLGLPRGGVVVALEIAKEFKAPLDVLVVRKIGHPDNAEYAAAAVSANEIFLNPEATVSSEYIKTLAAKQRQEIKTKLDYYREFAPAAPLQDKVVIIVDDGVATGLSMRAAIAQARSQQPKKVFVGLPVGAAESVKELALSADRVFCLYAPMFFAAVGQFYDDFKQTTDEEVAEILKQSRG